MQQKFICERFGIIKNCLNKAPDLAISRPGMCGSATCVVHKFFSAFAKYFHAKIELSLQKFVKPNCRKFAVGTGKVYLVFRTAPGFMALA